MAFVLELECVNKSDVHMLSCEWEQETEWLSRAPKIILKQELSNVWNQKHKSVVWEHKFNYFSPHDATWVILWLYLS